MASATLHYPLTDFILNTDAARLHELHFTVNFSGHITVPVLAQTAWPEGQRTAHSTDIPIHAAREKLTEALQQETGTRQYLSRALLVVAKRKIPNQQWPQSAPRNSSAMCR